VGFYVYFKGNAMAQQVSAVLISEYAGM